MFLAKKYNNSRRTKRGETKKVIENASIKSERIWSPYYNYRCDKGSISRRTDSFSPLSLHDFFLFLNCSRTKKRTEGERKMKNLSRHFSSPSFIPFFDSLSPVKSTSERNVVPCSCLLLNRSSVINHRTTRHVKGHEREREVHLTDDFRSPTTLCVTFSLKYLCMKK